MTPHPISSLFGAGAAWRLTLLLGILTACLAARAEGATWINVDTNRLTLTVLQGAKPVRHYENISIGRKGAGVDKRQQDNRTPLGEYRVTHVRPSSDFRIFIGIDYPNLRDAERGFEDGLISLQSFRAIRDAGHAGRQPPQETALGGYIGIHGVGEGDPKIHAAFNWTNGCIALTNEQIADLARWVRPGTAVLIH